MATSFGGELFRRRVPQFLGVYLAAGWGVLEFTDFLVNRYVLSPHLTDLALLAWALMLPTILMLAWFHGAPGRDHWTRIERIGIPVNVVLAAILLVVVFQGKELGAATTSVTVETEAGESVERVIPKSAFRKHLAVFFFDNESADTALDWLQYGIPWGLRDDLLQDIFLDVQTGEPVNLAQTNIISLLRAAGYADGLGAPLALKRDIAEQLHRGHFVIGSIGSSGDQLTVTTQLYETSRGKLLEERTFSGVDPFTLIDEISTQLRIDLGVPAQHIEETRDLPVAEMHTESATAYRALIEAMRDMMTVNDWASAATKLDAAVAEDPTYAAAHMSRFVTYLFLNDAETATAALEAGLDHSYKLPERAQFAAKLSYYRVVKQDMERAQAVVGMWAELYPDDLAAHSLRAMLYLANNQRERAIEAYQRVLELDPGQYDLLRQIGALYLSLGEFDAAQGYYQQYAERFPDDPRSFTALGQLSSLRGEHQAARQHYERAYLLDPGNVGAITSLAEVEYDLGDFDAALEHLEEGLAASASPDERAQALDALRTYYQRRGESRRAVEYMHSYWEQISAGQAPANALLAMFGNLDTYVDAGMTGAALDTLASVTSRLAAPLNLLAAVGELSVGMARNDADQIEAALGGMDELIEGLGFEILRFAQIRGGGRLLELQGDCEQAIISYERVLSLQPNSASTRIDIGRCHRKLGNYAEAEASLQRTLSVAPYSGLAHLELARVYSDMGSPEQAIEHLETALTVWQNADPGYQRASEARQLMESLRG
jgi:tetratricopeptide (TPR) repeat protein